MLREEGYSVSSTARVDQDLLDGHHAIGEALPNKAADQASQAVLQELDSYAQAAVDGPVARVAVLTGSKHCAGDPSQDPLQTYNQTAHSPGSKGVDSCRCMNLCTTASGR